MVERWSSKPHAWVRFLLSLLVVLSKKKRLVQSKKKLKKNTQLHPSIIGLNRWQKRLIWPVRITRRRSWRRLKRCCTIRFFLNLRRNHGFLRRFLTLKALKPVTNNNIPLQWSKRPFYTKRFRRTLYKTASKRYYWRRSTILSYVFYKKRVKRRFSRPKHRFNLFRRLKTLKFSLFRRNLRRRVVKKLIRRRRIMKKFRFRTFNNTFMKYVSYRSRRTVSVWGRRMNHGSVLTRRFPEVIKKKRKIRALKSSLLRYSKVRKKPSYLGYFLFSKTPYSIHFAKNVVDLELNLTSFSFIQSFHIHYLNQSTIKYTFSNSLSLTLQSTALLNEVATQPLVFGVTVLRNLLTHSKILQRLAHTHFTSRTNKKVSSLNSENVSNLPYKIRRKIQTRQSKNYVARLRRYVRRRSWTKSTLANQFRQVNKGVRNSSSSNKANLTLMKFWLLNRCNRLFIRTLKLKVGFYRITLPNFLTSYMIRLLPKHFKWSSNLWASRLKTPFPLSKQVLRDSHARSSITTKLFSINPSQEPNTGQFSLVSNLQNFLFLGGFWNQRRRKPSKKRWDRQVSKLFIKYLRNSGSTTFRSRGTTFIYEKDLLISNPPSNYLGGSSGKVFYDYRNSLQLLQAPSFVMQYLTLKDLFTLPSQGDWVKTVFTPWSMSLSLHFFSDSGSAYTSSNLFPQISFRKSLTRKLLKLFKFHRFSKNVTMWYYNMLIRFLENCTGRKIYIKFNPFLENYVSFSDSARCAVWLGRIRSFQRILGPKIFLHESLKILCVSIRSKDPTLLASWLRGMLYRISFWKYRIIFRYLKFLLRYLFSPQFSAFGFRGFKLRLKGKISVAGNARTRTLQYSVGETSYSKFDHSVVSDFNTINTFTGVLGFRIWFFF